MSQNQASASQPSGSWGEDFMASIVVFLIALPLCLGIAIAAGYPPAAGLISGIIGGIIVGYFSGCPLQVSGPAAGLIAIIWEAVNSIGIEAVGLAIALAGVIQIGMGVFRLGQWFRAVSPAVIQGMLAGIGVLIFASQFHVMVDDAPRSSALENLVAIPDAVMKGVFPLDGSTHHMAAAIGILTILTIVAWNISSDKLPEKLKIIPGPLVAVIVAVVGASFFQLPIKYVEIPSDLLESVTLLDPALIGRVGEPDVIMMAITIAFIASAETLLTATAVDQMTTRSRTKYNKEVIAQGIGNTLAGILGALPITGVIVRSSANVAAGAVSKKSTIMHGLWLLMFVIAFPFVLEYIPVASLAAILVYTGYKLVNVQAIKKLAEFGRSEVFIYFATVVGIVATNLLEGVLIGLGLAILKQLYTHSYLSISKEKDDNNQCHIYLAGSANFLTLPKLATELEEVMDGQCVHVHIEELGNIDHACIELLTGWKKQYMMSGGEVYLEWDGMMKRCGSLREPASRRNQKLVKTPLEQHQEHGSVK